MFVINFKLINLRKYTNYEWREKDNNKKLIQSGAKNK